MRRWRAEPELRVAIDTSRGEQPNIDVLLVDENDRGPVAVAIEAEVEEAFGLSHQGADRYQHAQAVRPSDPCSESRWLGPVYSRRLVKTFASC